jgi:transcriptional regulator with XRE-family HTH domain
MDYENDYKNFIAERIPRLREKKGASARSMSLDLGQSAGYINMIENKRNLPSMSMFICICEYLSVTPKEFFDEGDSHPALSNDLNEILENLEEADLLEFMGIALKLLKNRRLKNANHERRR